MGKVIAMLEMERIGRAREELKAKIEKIKSEKRVREAMQSKVVYVKKISERQLRELRAKGFMVVMEYEGNYKL